LERIDDKVRSSAAGQFYWSIVMTMLLALPLSSFVGAL
jgi:hypothetical protein